MTAFSDFQSDLILNQIYRSGASIRPAGVHIALLTAAPSDTDTGATMPELTGGGYARQTVTQLDGEWTAPADRTGGGREIGNVNAVQFGPATGSDWAAVDHFAVMDAVGTGTGNIVMWGALAQARIVQVGETGDFAAGDINPGVD